MDITVIGGGSNIITTSAMLLPPPRRRLCDQCGLSAILSAILSYCVQNYCKNNMPISLKLNVVIGPTSRKN